MTSNTNICTFTQIKYLNTSCAAVFVCVSSEFELLYYQQTNTLYHFIFRFHIWCLHLLSEILLSHVNVNWYAINYNLSHFHDNDAMSRLKVNNYKYLYVVSTGTLTNYYLKTSTSSFIDINKCFLKFSLNFVVIVGFKTSHISRTTVEI